VSRGAAPPRDRGIAEGAAARSVTPSLSTILVSMPFMDADRPSIQLGLLTSIANDHGFPTRAVHANLEFAGQLGADDYRKLADHRGALIGDWLFSVEAFGDAAPDPDGALLEEFADALEYLGPSPRAVRAWLLAVRSQYVPKFLDAMVNLIDWRGTDIVGFTSSFQQNTASFALARRLKARHPRLITVFGGANFDGDMGLEFVRSVDWIDVAVVGEADEAFPRLLSALAVGDDPGPIPGVVSRLNGELTATAPALVHELNASPVPNYDDYFERAERLGLISKAARRRTWIPLETSRGCWWGEKHHCVFCGLNGTAMQFRAKSADRVLEELATLAYQSGSFRFACVDNILDVRYLLEFFPAIIESGADYQFFYEVKSNLTRAQLRLLAKGGVTHIQPGLESLSTAVLRRMRKGVTAAQNVNLLRWARYYGMDVGWNILWGIPGETVQDYAQQLALVPKLAHLQPPDTDGRIWLERFSPMFTELPDDQFRLKAPERSYSYVYPAGIDLTKAAYFFDYELKDALPDHAYDDLHQAIEQWRKAWQDTQPQLTYWFAPGLLQIYDGRWPDRQRSYTFRGKAAEVYVACSERLRSAAAVHDELALDVGVEEVRGLFDEFEQLGLMMLDNEHALALALPAINGR
jgi:ribosomal peptide maturation radical SAM protein 1